MLSLSQLSQATCSNTDLMPSAGQVIRTARSPLKSRMLGNSYMSDHTRKKINLKDRLLIQGMPCSVGDSVFMCTLQDASVFPGS